MIKPPSAILASSIAPGILGGGEQGALAYVQAISKVYDGDVIYVGPAPADGGASLAGTKLRELIALPERSLFRVASDLLLTGCLDRLSTSPITERIIANAAPDRTIVYVFGEAAGKLVVQCRVRSLRTVFQCNNYMPEYLNAQMSRCNPVSKLIAGIRVKQGLLGFRMASYRLCVSEQDRQAYLKVTGASPDDGASRGDMYFSYDEPWSAQAKDAGDQRCRDTINVSAYLGQKFNERGILWFLNSIWPAIRNEFPHLRLVVTGANPPASIVQATGRAGGEMKVRPSPLEMNHVYARSLLSVAPTLDGSGIKVRVAESLRRGVPVLSTQHCAVGYDKISRSVLKLFADAGQAVAGVRDIVGGDRVQLGEACITEWEREFSLAQGVRKLREVHEWLATR